METELEERVAKAKMLKQEPFEWDKIKRFFQLSDKTSVYQVISDRTCQDLDLDELFMFIDRTSSKVGQQMLYATLRTLHQTTNRTQRLEKIIHLIDEHANLRKTLLSQLASLTNTNVYAITSLFLKKHNPKPGWFWLVKGLAFASVSSVLLAFVFPQTLLLLLPLLAVNFSIHYWNKNNLYQYAGSIPQLARMNQVAKQFRQHEALESLFPDITPSIEAIERLGPQMSLFKLEAKLQSEVGLVAEYALELIKALFLIEPLIFYNVLEEISRKRSQIESVYQYIGELDMAMSIYLLREDLPFYCLPTLLVDQKQLLTLDAYHPLIDRAVPNSIDVSGKSVLLSGSNMSGKTTFIRTMGINAILAQTLNTCFARQWQMPKLKIHSAIRVSDDLLSAKSYYFEEVLTIKNLLEESQSDECHLFLLDELFKGTNTVERVASGKAVLSYLHQQSNLVFVATHDLELAELLKDSFSLFHFTEIVQQDKVWFDYKLKGGPLRDTNAIRILELNNYPEEVIQEAAQLASRMTRMKDS
ncbi:MutS-related protein [Spirosoma jeollabukense]